MLTAETKRRIDACRDILVGKLPLPTDQVELITLALIYKFMDDLDEESVQLGGKRSFFTGSLEQYRWRSLLPQTVSADTRLTLFADGIEALGSNDKAAHLPALFRDIFRNAFLKFRDGRILTLFLNEVNGFAYSHSEELGNAFEYLLQCMGTQGENGQFRTPRHIIDFIVACLDPKPGETILDPACGTGGFLVSAYKHILAKHTSPQSTIPGDKLTHAQRQKVYSSITGYDITDLMVKLSKVNLFLHGFPDPGIHIYDTLSNDARWNEKADVILANPPFMTPKGGVTPHTKFRIPAKKAEVLFTDYIAEHLNSAGRAGVIVPNGIVATTQNAYARLRRFLVEDSLVAVISLPSGVFKPYSGVKCSILLLDKRLARTQPKILFLKIASDGFELGDKRAAIDANDLPQAECTLKSWFAGQLGRPVPNAAPISREELLATRDVSLSTEKYLGEAVSSSATVPLLKLGEIASFEYGKPLKEEDRSGSGFPVYGSNGEVGRHRESLVSGPFIVVGRKGSAGAVTWSDEGGWPIDTTYFVSLKREDVDLRFLYWMLRRAELHRLVEQAGVPGLNRNDAYDVEIPLPSLDQQRRAIVEISGYQKVADGARQIIAAYEPRVPTSPDWPTARVSDIAEFKNGVNYTKENAGHGIKVLGVRHFQSNVVAPLDDLDEINPDGIVGSGLVLEDGDLIFVRSNGNKELVGRCMLVQTAGLRLTHSAFTIRMRLDRSRCEPKFYALLLRLPEYRGQMFGSGANISNLSQDILKSIELPVPPLEEQRRIICELDDEARQIEAVREIAAKFDAKTEAVLDRVCGNGVSE